MNLPQFYQWSEQLRTQFPNLKKWQGTGLMLISYGILKARRSQASLIAEEMPEFGKASTVERRIQRWLVNPRIDLAQCGAHWVGWVLRNYPGELVYLLVDETKIGNRIGCMMLSLAVQKRAIPLVWRCYRANSAADYPAEGQNQLIVDLVAQVQAALPENKTLILQADRGIGTSSNLMRAIHDLGVNYLFRVQAQAHLKLPTGQWTTLQDLIQPGQVWMGQGILYRGDRGIPSYIHLRWRASQAEPWCLATQMKSLDGREYAWRMWQEESFRDLKSGGWQWQASLLRNPDIVERLLLPMAIAYTWCVSWGLLFLRQDPKKRLQIDCLRKHPKYCVFRMGLRYFKQALYRDPTTISFQLGPFPAPT